MTDTVGDCPSCQTALSAEDKRSDHHAPAVGYDYYECPECGHQARPERIESDSDPATDTPDSDRSDADDAATENSYRDGLSPDLQAVYDIIEDQAEDGDAADRDEVITAIIQDRQVAPDVAEDLLNDLLQRGGCYEPEDGKLAPI